MTLQDFDIRLPWAWVTDYSVSAHYGIGATAGTATAVFENGVIAEYRMIGVGLGTPSVEGMMQFGKAVGVDSPSDLAGTSVDGSLSLGFGGYTASQSLTDRSVRAYQVDGVIGYDIKSIKLFRGLGVSANIENYDLVRVIETDLKFENVVSYDQLLDYCRKYHW
jgi:hypothetical protein